MPGPAGTFFTYYDSLGAPLELKSHFQTLLSEELALFFTFAPMFCHSFDLAKVLPDLAS